MLDRNPSVFADLESPKAICCRFIIYTIVLLVFTLSLPIIVQHGDIAFFKEGGPVENTQLFLIMGTGSLLFAGAMSAKVFRELFIVLALLTALASVRELDSFLDRLNPFFGWRLPGGIVIACGIAFAWRKRRKLWPQSARFLTLRSFAVLWAGFMLVGVFAQLIGHGTLLEMVMGDDYRRDYKRVIEETIELAGYLILFFGGVESWCQARAFSKLPGDSRKGHPHPA